MRAGPATAVGAILLVLGACGRGSEPAGSLPADRPASVAERFWPVYRAASAARRDGDRVGALALYLEALQIDPDHGDTLYFVGQLRYERGELAAAVDAIGRLGESEPRGLRAWQQLSVLHGRAIPGWLPDLQGALAQLEPAMSLNPAESRNHYLEGRWRAYRGEIDAARASLAEAAGYNPQFHDGDLLISWILERSGERDAARDLRQSLVERLCASDPEGCAGAPVARGVKRRLGGGRETIDPERTTLTTVETLARLGAETPAVRLDLDGDGSADLLAAGPASGGLVLLTAGEPSAPVPGAAVAGWAGGIASESELGRRSTPWTAVGWRSSAGRRVVIAGGGDRPLRLFAGEGTEVVPGLGAWSVGLTLPVLAAGDLDGDGVDELLVANVPDRRPEAAGGLVGLLLREADGGLEISEILPGPLSAASIADLDGDGDADLVVGRYPAARGIREERLVAAVGEDGRSAFAAAVSPQASVWLTSAGRLGEEIVLDGVDLPVRAFAAVGAGRLMVAMGDLEPERPALESVWQVGALAAAPVDLNGSSGSACLALVAVRGTGVLCQRGGLLPAEPARLELIRRIP